MLTISVRERSVAPVTETAFRALEGSAGFWTLVDLRILSLVRTGDLPFGVRAGAYVGEAVLDESIRLVVDEKSPNALRSLLHWAAPGDFREASTPSLVGSGGAVLDVFARVFLQHLGDYLRRGRLKSYVQIGETSSYPKGRIDVRASLRLLARGRQGTLAFTRQVLTPDLLCNRLLALALSCVDRYLVLRNALDLLAFARTYAPLFQDVNWRRLERVAWSDLRDLYDDEISQQSHAPSLSTALRYARSLALQLGAWPEATASTSIPASYFLSLERLFEDAVRNTISGLVSDAVKGSKLGVGLFREICESFIVDPDIVIGKPPLVRLVADCKYKQLDGAPEHHDVYQLVAHCNAIQSATGVLLYPGSSTRVRCLGKTTTGVSVFYATVALETLKGALEAVLTECGAHQDLVSTEVLADCNAHAGGMPRGRER